MGAMRAVMGAFAIGLVTWGAWEMSDVLRDRPDASNTNRVRSLVLITDGVLDKNWLIDLGHPVGGNPHGPRPKRAPRPDW